MRATLEWFHGFAASDFGDPSAAEAMVGRALAGFRAAGDRWGIAAALSTRAKLAMIRGNLTAASDNAQQSLAIFRELGDRWGQLQAIEWLGAAQAATGDHAQAGRLHRDGLHMAEELGLWPQAADALSWLGRGRCGPVTWPRLVSSSNGPCAWRPGRATSPDRSSPRSASA